MSGLINKTHSRAARGLDAYFTPPEAVLALAKIETLPLSIADPCCGNGAILEALKTIQRPDSLTGTHIVFGSDIVDYGWPNTILRDYLTAPVIMAPGVGIVSNPPYRHAQQFIQKALADGAEYHAWLFRLNFLESLKRKPFFEANPPSRIWLASRRLPMMHRLGWEGSRAASNCCHAWFVWSAAPDKLRVGFFNWGAL
jgi:hypothetical protein